MRAVLVREEVRRTTSLTPRLSGVFTRIRNLHGAAEALLPGLESTAAAKLRTICRDLEARMNEAIVAAQVQQHGLDTRVLAAVDLDAAAQCIVAHVAPKRLLDPVLTAVTGLWTEIDAIRSKDRSLSVPDSALPSRSPTSTGANLTKPAAATTPAAGPMETSGGEGPNMAGAARAAANVNNFAAHELDDLIRATRDAADQLQDLIPQLFFKTLEAVVAPAEADATLAELSRTDFADTIITEDSDLVILGSKQVRYRLVQDSSRP